MLWLCMGQVSLGVLVGALLGLSKSPVVGVALPIIFTFAGGSVIGLAKGQSDAQLTQIGLQLVAFCVPTLISMVVSARYREGGGAGLSLRGAKDHPEGQGRNP
jgi:hypothetical protein